jgi:hypothetical protein
MSFFISDSPQIRYADAKPEPRLPHANRDEFESVFEERFKQKNYDGWWKEHMKYKKGESTKTLKKSEKNYSNATNKLRVSQSKKPEQLVEEVGSAMTEIPADGGNKALWNKLLKLGIAGINATKNLFKTGWEHDAYMQSQGYPSCLTYQMFNILDTEEYKVLYDFKEDKVGKKYDIKIADKPSMIESKNGIAVNYYVVRTEITTEALTVSSVTNIKTHRQHYTALLYCEVEGKLAEKYKDLVYGITKINGNKLQTSLDGYFEKLNIKDDTAILIPGQMKRISFGSLFRFHPILFNQQTTRQYAPGKDSDLIDWLKSDDNSINAFKLRDVLSVALYGLLWIVSATSIDVTTRTSVKKTLVDIHNFLTGGTAPKTVDNFDELLGDMTPGAVLNCGFESPGHLTNYIINY